MLSIIYPLSHPMELIPMNRDSFHSMFLVFEFNSWLRVSCWIFYLF